MDLGALIERALMFVLAPLWLVAGWLDYACHRREAIETSAGWPESLLHLVLLAELGIGVLVGLFLEINAAALAVMLAACVAHEITVWSDLSYADARRHIPPFEQWVHGLQQVLPWVAFAALVAMHWAQAAALLGIGDARPDWRLRIKDDPLPPTYVIAFLGAALLGVVAPFVSEFVRCRRAARPRPLRAP